MFDTFKRWLSSLRPATKNKSSRGPERWAPAADPLRGLEHAPLSLDAQLAIANNRMTEAMIRAQIAQNVRRFRESTNNPGALWAASFVDPFDWAQDTPNFYPGFSSNSWAVPWMLNNQGTGDVLPVYINEYGLKLIRDWSRRLLAFNEFAINAAENRVSYIAGKGFKYTVLARRSNAGPQALGNETGIEKSDLAAKAQAVLDEFISRSQWNEREQEIIRRCDRDGEAILRFFRIGGGRAAVRFVEPECMTDGEGTTRTKYGVITEPGDVETVVGYSIVENPSVSWTPTRVEAADVLHIKLNTDFDSKRGLPTFFPVRKNLERADKLLRNMSVMAQVQATFAVVRKHKGFAPSSVAAFQQAQTDVQGQNPLSGRATNLQQMPPGSIVDASENTTYDFPSAGVDASGLVAILQAELRAVSARLVMPEFMLTGNADAPFANVMVAGAPSVEKFKRDQAFFARRFGDGVHGMSEAGAAAIVGAMWRVLEIAVQGGLLPPETLELVEIQAEGPSVCVVNKVAETNRAKTLNEAGLLSPETWAKWEGLDYTQEVKLGAKPKQQAPAGPGGPGGSGGPGMPGGPGGSGSGGGIPPASPPGSGGLFEALTEEIKRVFGRCVDTDSHKVVPCPQHLGSKQGGKGKAKAKAEKPPRPTVDEAKALHDRISNGKGSPAEVAAFAETLGRMRVKDIRALKKQTGIRAGGVKAQQIAKVTHQASKILSEREHWQRQARIEGVRPADLMLATRDMYRGQDEYISTVQSMLKETRALYASETGGALNRNHRAFKGGDLASIKGFDAIARTMADRYPELLGAHGYSNSGANYDDKQDEAAQRLYDFLLAGTPPRPKRADVYPEALAYLRDHFPASGKPFAPAGSNLFDEVPF